MMFFKLGMSVRVIDLAILERPTSLSLLGGAPGGPGGGMFDQDAIDRAIARAAAQVEDGHFAVIVHADTRDGVSASTVARVGGHVYVKAAVLWDGHGFKREDLAFSGEIVARW